MDEPITGATPSLTQKAVAAVTALLEPEGKGRDQAFDAVLHDYRHHREAANSLVGLLGEYAPLPREELDIILAGLRQLSVANDELGQLGSGLADLGKVLVTMLAATTGQSERDLLNLIASRRPDIRDAP